MSDEVKKAHADEIFKIICESLNGEFECSTNDEKRFIKFSTVSADVPIRIYISVDEKRQVVKLLSFMPFCFPADRITDACIAACSATNKLANGCFSVDINEGNIMFKQTVSVFNTSITSATVKNLVDTAYSAIEKYNDKFLSLLNNELSLEEFVSLQ